MTGALFSPDFLRRLEALAIATRRSLPGSGVGPRRAPAIGASVEFSDFRSYTPGDDYRRIDWNAYARLERLFLRLYRAEENLNVSLLVDTSASMSWGQPRKFDLARQVAGSLAYIALARDDRVGAAGLGESLHPHLPPVASRASVWRVWEFLEALPCGGATDLGKALASFGGYSRRSGLVVVLTDLLTESDWRGGLRALLGLRHEVVLLQVLAPEELDPSLSGDWRLVDDEDGRPVEVSVTPRALDAYRERLSAYTREVASFCHGHRIAFLQLRSDIPVEDAVLRLMRRAQVVV
ncbi:MAG: DUF58 domain-containing protein [Chloroflexi bacterium]|nr:DUF58 domain-containing protein [Chloroflexota bacterium]